MSVPKHLLLGRWYPGD